MARRRDLGTSWWANEFLDALEKRALTDPNRLPRGRTYARRGAVIGLAADEQEITARVVGSRSAPYRVAIGLRHFGPEEKARVLETIAERIGFIAALEAGTVPPELAQRCRDRGVDLFPRSGDLSMRCSCPDRAIPCKHLAAVFYVIAEGLDDDPFQLLALRGLGRSEVTDALRSMRAASVPETEVERAEPSATMPAALLWRSREHATGGVGSGGVVDGDEAGAAEDAVEADQPGVWGSPEDYDLTARWEAVDSPLAEDLRDAAYRSAASLAGGPIDCALPPAIDAARRIADVGDGSAAGRVGLDEGLGEAFVAAWTAGGPLFVEATLAALETPTLPEFAVAEAARVALGGVHISLRRKGEGLLVVGRPLRLVGPPASIQANLDRSRRDREDSEADEPEDSAILWSAAESWWLVQQQVAGHWAVVAMAPTKQLAATLERLAGG